MKIVDLIIFAKKHGYNVTDRQVRLWTQEKLIPSEESKGKGYVLSYPSEAATQLLKICELKAKGINNYDDLAWSLFLLKYQCPTERIKVIMRNSLCKIPIPITQKDINSKNLFYVVLALFINYILHLSSDTKLLEFMKDIMETEARTCLGVGNSFRFVSHNKPESIFLIREEQQYKSLLNFEEYYKTHKDDERDILTRKNYTVPPNADDTLVAKLIFAQRINYLFNILLYIFEHLDISDCVNRIPLNVIEQYRDAIFPLHDDIEKLGSPFRSIYSLYFPIIWGVINILEQSEFIYDDWFPEEIQEEPWFKNSPLRAVADMIRALRHTTKLIIP